MDLIGNLGDPEKLMQAVRDKLQPMVDGAEDKALAALHVESIALMTVVQTQLAALNKTFATMFAGYVISITKP